MKSIRLNKSRVKKAVLLINDTTYAFNLRGETIKKLIDQGYEVIVVGQLLQHQERLKAMGAKVIGIETERHGMNPFSDFVLMRTYRRILCEESPNVVLTYNIKPNVYGGIACMSLKIPYISNITGLGSPLENPGILRKLIIWLYKTGISGASYVFFQNNGNKDFFEQHKMLNKQAKVKVLPGSGVNLDKNYYESYPTEKNGIRFLFVGRIMKDKGIRELLQAIHILRNEYEHICLDVVGSCDEDYSDVLERSEKKGEIKYHGLQENVHPFYAFCHCTVLPSYHEGMANVMLEASATGRPVITTTIPGCRETFDEGITGYGCQAKNVDSLVQAMKRFIALTPEEREKMGKAARLKMERDFDREKVNRAYLDAVKSIDG